MNTGWVRSSSGDLEHKPIKMIGQPGLFKLQCQPDPARVNLGCHWVKYFFKKINGKDERNQKKGKQLKF